MLADSQVDLRKSLQAFHEHANEYKLEVNLDKTKLIIFRKGGHHRLKKLTSFSCGVAQVEIVNQYNYLGIIFSNSATFVNNFNATMKKINKSAGSRLKYSKR